MSFNKLVVALEALKLLFLDQHLVAIDKPPGLLVHRSRVDVQATEFALQRLRDQLQQPVFPVHRIDRPTSGVLLFGLNQNVARTLSEQFQRRQVEKEYLAIVRGHPPERTHWNEPLLEKHDRMTDQKAQKSKPAQEAQTDFESICHWTLPFSAGKYPHSRYSLIKAIPKTGRKHQIRRHLNHMAYPIIGDTTYGDRRHNRLFRERLGISRLQLVAKLLTIRHPLSGHTITIEADNGREFDDAIRRMDEYALGDTV
ncbi:MAG: pseudouridine synthase [Planctomycetota bacterium]